MKEEVQKEPQRGEDVETTARKKRGRIKRWETDWKEEGKKEEQNAWKT